MAGETTNADGYTATALQTHSKQVGVVDATHEVTTGELELADKIRIGKVPAGATYLGGYLATDDLDSNGTPALVLTLGDDDDADGIVATGTVGQAAGITRADGAYVTNRTTTTAEKTIYVTVGTAAATAAAGTLRAVVEYYVE